MPAESLALFISLYLDEDVYKTLPALLRVQGYDVISAQEVGQEGEAWTDERQLTFAAEHKRAILTHNDKHFRPLAENWGLAGREHSGIIVTEQLGIGEVLRRLLRFLDTVTADEMKNSFRYL